MSFQKFLKKNLKFSFYLKKHTLKPYPDITGIYYIVKFKGKKRLKLSQLNLFKKNLNSYSFWDKLINYNNNELYQIETQRIQSHRENIPNFNSNVNFDLKERQKYAVKNAKGRILDVGFSYAITLCYLHQKGFDCEGVDFGDMYIEIGRKNFNHVGGDTKKLKKGLFQNLPYRNKTFDTVISQETIEHFLFPQVMTKEIWRVLKSGGYFIGSTPLKNKIDSETHIMYYTLEGIKALLEKYFKIKDLQLVKNLPSDHNPKLILWIAEKE